MKRRSTCVALNNKDGAALLTVLTVFLVVIVFVVSATMVSMANFDRSRKSSDHASTYYVAETGFNEYYQVFTDYFNDNHADEVFDAGYVANFIATLDVDQNGIKHFDFGELMNKQARAEVKMEFIESVADVYKISIESTGYLGDESRSVSVVLTVDNEILSVGYSPDSFLALEYPPYGSTGAPTELLMPPNQTMTGPMVTNKPAKAGSTTYHGAFVTNNLLSFNLNYVNWSDAVVISSNRIEFKQSPLNTIKAVVLKPGGYLDLNNGVMANSVKIKYLMLPMSAQGNLSSYFRMNGVANASVMNAILASSKVLYYNPVGFNPFDATQYVAHSGTMDFNPSTVFGKEPDLDSGVKGTFYRDYFKANFILDNNDPEEASRYLPTVKLPKRPVYREVHVDGTPYTRETFVNSSALLVDDNNNLKNNISDFWSGNKVINLGQSPHEYTGATTSERHYNSFTIAGSPVNSDPLIINVGNRDVTIVTKSLKWDGTVRIVGTGSLKIFVIGRNGVITPADIQFNFTSVTLRETLNGSNHHDVTKFQIFVYETSTPVTINTQTGNNFEFNGIIFSDNLNLVSKIDFYGSFISGKGTNVRFDDAGTGIKAELIFAPNAKIHLGGSTFKGVAVGKEYSYSGSINVSFESDFSKAFNDVLDSVISIGGGDGSGSGSKGTLKRAPIREVKP